MGIKTQRLRAGYTQAHLAALLGVDQSNVSYWESGRHLPQAATLKDLALVLGCTMEDLLAPDDRRTAMAPKPRSVTIDMSQLSPAAYERIMRDICRKEEEEEAKNE